MHLAAEAELTGQAAANELTQRPEQDRRTKLDLRVGEGRGLRGDPNVAEDGQIQAAGYSRHTAATRGFGNRNSRQW